MEVKLVGEVYGWVTKEARERSVYSGRADSRVVTGREYDVNGAPVSGVESVIVSDALGVTTGATVVMPDTLAADVPVGAVVGVSGSNGLSARIVGGDAAKQTSTARGGSGAQA